MWKCNTLGWKQYKYRDSFAVTHLQLHICSYTFAFILCTIYMLVATYT